MTDKKDYWIDKIVYSGVPGCDVSKSLAQAFNDYFNDPKVTHEIQIKLNHVTVTMKKTQS